jgi:hypothetical protein
MSATAALPAISLPLQPPQYARKKSPNPVFRGISTDVIISGSSSATIRLLGAGQKTAVVVDITDCEQNHTKIRVDNPQPAAFTVTIPASLAGCADFVPNICWQVWLATFELRGGEALHCQKVAVKRYKRS